MKYFLLIAGLIMINSSVSQIKKVPTEHVQTAIAKKVTPETPKGFQLPEGWIFDIMQHYCDSLKVPVEYIYDVGMNESGWKNPNDSNFIQGPDYVPTETSHGDLQMINPTWRIWAKRLNLKHKNRKNLLIACIAYQRYCYDIGGNWEKARYIYARGKWKPKSKWTKLEKRFMNKMDFEKY